MDSDIEHFVSKQQYIRYLLVEYDIFNDMSVSPQTFNFVNAYAEHSNSETLYAQTQSVAPPSKD